MKYNWTHTHQTSINVYSSYGLISILICHTCEVDGLSGQRRSAH